MKRLGKIAVGLAGGLVLNAGLRAAVPTSASVPVSANNPSSDNPYVMISSRNIFGLVPPVVAVVDTNAQLIASLPKIMPTGIMGVFGHWQVLFKVTPVKPAPGAKEDTYILSEGQMQDEIEVIKIDDEKSLVTFNNHGIMQDLPLVEVSASGAAAASSGGGMMNPGMAGGAPGGSSGPGGIIQFGAGAGGNNGGFPNSNPGSNGGGPSGANGANAGLNFGENTQGHIYQPEASNMTPEQSAVIFIANKFDAYRKNDPSAPLYPPSPLDKEAGTPSNTAPAPEPTGPPNP